MTMTPEKLELLREWVQAECRQVYYKCESDDTVCEDIDYEWNEVCKQHADATFFKVVMAFCNTN